MGSKTLPRLFYLNHRFFIDGRRNRFSGGVAPLNRLLEKRFGTGL